MFLFYFLYFLFFFDFTKFYFSYPKLKLYTFIHCLPLIPMHRAFIPNTMIIWKGRTKIYCPFAERAHFPSKTNKKYCSAKRSFSVFGCLSILFVGLSILSNRLFHASLIITTWVFFLSSLKLWPLLKSSLKYFFFSYLPPQPQPLGAY